METTQRIDTSHAHDKANMRVASLTGFTAPRTLPADEQEGNARRFSTLFIDERRRRKGGLGQVLYGEDTWGEPLAVKLVGEAHEEEHDDSPSRAFACEAFRREYETMRTLSDVKGFPRLYGTGKLDGRDAILMEWVEGETLATAIRHLSIDDEGRLSPLTAAQMGRDLFALLARMEVLENCVVHRDISISNIMVDTSARSLDDQVAAGSFDLKLVDFGSAMLPGRSSSLTQKYGTPRGATPDFAPPEMLSEDVKGAAAMRKNPAVDVYAAASVLYLLLAGHTPFLLEKGDERSYYLQKTEQLPRALTGIHATAADVDITLTREPHTATLVEKAIAESDGKPSSEKLAGVLTAVDSQLDDVIFACLDPVQEYRPLASEVQDTLADFVDSYEANIANGLAERPLSQCAGDAFERRAANVRRRRARHLGMGMVIACAVLLFASSCAAGILLDGELAKLALGPMRWGGALSGWVVGVLLWLPAAFGCVTRFVARRSPHVLAWAIAAVGAGALVLLGILACTIFFSAQSLVLALAALAVSATLPWCALSFDVAMRGMAARPSEEVQAGA